MLITRFIATVLLTGSLAFSLKAKDVHPAVEAILGIPSLVALWDFQEEGSRKSKGGDQIYELEEQNGSIQRVNDGVLGPYAARLDYGEFFKIERAKIGALNIHGKQAQVTVAAWIKRDSKQSWQAIAGVWDESHKKRQYCLFLNAPRGTKADEMVRYPLFNRIHGHVSGVGGPTKGDKFCITYSSGKTNIPMKEWVFIAMSYDGKFSKVFVNGKLDAWDQYNPFPYEEGLFDGGENGGDFTVGAVHRSDEWGNFFGGDLGGIAIFNRALKEEELAHLAKFTAAKKAQK